MFAEIYRGRLVYRLVFFAPVVVSAVAYEGIVVELA
jgi:hypothetical protein